jgi:hypothetical protein
MTAVKFKEYSLWCVYISSEHSKNISLPADEESDMAEDISEDDAKESPFLLTNC